MMEKGFSNITIFSAIMVIDSGVRDHHFRKDIKIIA